MHGRIVQKPQMSSLLFEYDIDILWCDIGGPTTFPQLGASWYNHAASQNRQVVMNNRCGANQSDFVTPEYATFSALLVCKCIFGSLMSLLTFDILLVSKVGE